ncbi:hypothetical protein [Streptomyces albipurpureus]|uniref:YcxB-like protein domain-containing protein n=1 Tax=Streptomyces albipurpureus TaxID=2897419 RepID=A0ABT0UM97_9ACTN|nr:hypothetical protein [Streptomyces sp. CWNU-1]MCM2388523.1 hypothetical protein [Streptomyces sp. CWNU-1]
MSEDIEVRAVELVYRPTVDDTLTGFLIQRRKTPSGRGQLVGWPIAAVAAFVGAWMRLDGTGSWGDPVVLTLLVGGLFLMTMTLCLPRMMARQMHKLIDQRGEYHAVVDEHGVQMTAEGFAQSADWKLLTRYTETDERFVLLGADKSTLGLVVLPKRGLPPGPGTSAIPEGSEEPESAESTEITGAESLRTVLDRHLQRI